MKTIFLSQGKITLVDDQDYPELSKHRWYAEERKDIGTFYAMRNTPRINGKHGTIRMHRQIFPGHHKVDHKDHDGLNNQRHNLRPCNNSQNGMNRRGPQVISSSGLRGVGMTRAGNWRARIKVGYKEVCLGTFGSKEQAAAEYAKANRMYFGEFGGALS